MRRTHVQCQLVMSKSQDWIHMCWRRDPYTKNLDKEVVVETSCQTTNTFEVRADGRVIGIFKV